MSSSSSCPPLAVLLVWFESGLARASFPHSCPLLGLGWAWLGSNELSLILPSSRPLAGLVWAWFGSSEISPLFFSCFVGACFGSKKLSLILPSFCPSLGLGPVCLERERWRCGQLEELGRQARRYSPRAARRRLQKRRAVVSISHAGVCESLFDCIRISFHRDLCLSSRLRPHRALQPLRFLFGSAKLGS